MPCNLRQDVFERDVKICIVHMNLNPNKEKFANYMIQAEYVVASEVTSKAFEYR